MSIVLFDLDGTLIDTIEDLGEAVNHALKVHSLPLHSITEYRKMVGHGIRNLVWQALPADLKTDEALLDECLADFKSWYSAHIDVHTHPYEGIPELISELGTAGVKLAVVSNKFQEGTEHLIRRFFPEAHFEAVLGNREGYPLKPDPEIVQEVLQTAGENKSGAVMVGDSPTDMKTAENGGIRGIAVTWGYRNQEDLSAWETVHTVASLREKLL